MRRLIYELLESVRIAFAQIRANKTRSLLAALGIVIGTIAVTLMGTAINGIDATVQKSFAGFGEDVLYVSKRPWFEQIDWSIVRNRRDIKMEYAQEVNDWIAAHPAGPLKLAVPISGRGVNVLRGDFRVNNIYLQGTTADMPRISRSEVDDGRFFSAFEAETGANVAVIGFDVAQALFPAESAVGQNIRIRGQNFRVVGVVAQQGSFFGLWSWDSIVAIPLHTFRRHFAARGSSELRVQVDMSRADEARDELRGLMRRLRELQPEQRDDFGINEQAAVRGPIDDVKGSITVAGLFITGLSLFVGAIGIMNITYVSVKERTREIGTRKALGARRSTILLQFLIESVTICMIGGVVGVAITGGLFPVAAAQVSTIPLMFPASLVGIAVIVSFVFGILSGFLPALQASSLNPVEALRYE